MVEITQVYSVLCPFQPIVMIFHAPDRSQCETEGDEALLMTTVRSSGVTDRVHWDMRRIGFEQQIQHFIHNPSHPSQWRPTATMLIKVINTIIYSEVQEVTASPPHPSSHAHTPFSWNQHDCLISAETYIKHHRYSLLQPPFAVVSLSLYSS